MRFLAHALADLLSWLAILWTIYEEQHHLLLYLGDREIAFGRGEYIDILVTLTLIGYASYEILHFFGVSRAFDRYIVAHPALDALTLFLVAALCWAIYRDATHFHHLYVGRDGTQGFGDEFDELAAIFLALGAIKTGYHALLAVRALGQLTKRRALD